jgi:hypothetical protein
MRLVSAFLLLSSCGVPVQGPPGPTGPQGERGPTGPSAVNGTLFASAITCTSTIDGTALRFRYEATVLKNGDVLATAEIHDGARSTSGTDFYALTQDGAQTAPVLIVYDIAPPENSGFFRIELPRSVPAPFVTYFDVDVPGGQRVWTHAQDKCVTTAIP